MQNDVLARLFKLWAQVCTLVVKGKRDPESVADVLQQILEEKQRRLTALTSFEVASNTINPHDFFKDREGLWTSNNFDEFILSGASKKKVSGTVSGSSIGYADIVHQEGANDAEIGGELPEGYVFECVNNLLIYLATLIELQWGGKSGVLLNNGYANIFYIKINGEVFAVRVHWRAHNRRWYCYAARPVADRWVAGRRAFSATAA